MRSTSGAALLSPEVVFQNIEQKTANSIFKRHSVSVTRRIGFSTLRRNYFV